MRRLLKWMLYAFAGFVVIIAIAVALAPAPNTNPAAKSRAPEGSLGDGTKPQKQEDPPPIEDDTGSTGPKPEQKKPSKIEPRPEPKPEDYIQLSGTAGKASCSVMDDKNQRSVDSPVPGEIPIEAGFMSYVGATCQKVGAQGTLTVEIYQGGDRVKRGSTSAQYGVISIDNS